jgi:hypothetical protein
MHELLAMVVGAALSLAGHLSTDRLLRPIFRWLKEVLTVPATPFAHAGVVALRQGDQVFDLETVIECVPRPRQMVKFHNVNAGGNAVVLFRRRQKGLTGKFSGRRALKEPSNLRAGEDAEGRRLACESSVS